MKYLRITTGLGFLIVSALAVLNFEFLKNQFLFLSPDGVIDPDSFLQLRIFLISFSAPGCLLVFYNRVASGLNSLSNSIEGWNSKRFLFIALVSALALRVLAVALIPIQLWADSAGYDYLATNWIAQGGFYYEGEPTAMLPPGYPFLLSRLYLVFGQAPISGAIFNIFLSVGTCYLAYLIARRVWNERVARLTLVIMAIFPSQILFTNQIMTETTFTFLFLFAIWLIIRVDSLKNLGWLSLALAGIVLGLSALTRPLTLTWIPLAALYWFRSRLGPRAPLGLFAVTLIFFAMTVAPWMIRNQRELGLSAISSNGGGNFYIGDNPRSGVGWSIPDTAIFKLNIPALEASNDRLGYSLGWDFIKKNPARFLKMGVLKVAFLYSIDIDALHYEIIRAANDGVTDRYVILAGVTQLFYMFVLALALAGTWKFFTTKELRTPGAYLLLATLAYWAAVHFVYFGFGRFHFPVIPIISAFAAVFVCRCVNTTIGQKISD
ncbi:MAG: glycosyltransferase family 39 protein [candidate division Zixibacteria bacterium]|nr:glycosyltransferase family 39 protein [candidate division Zixibacteria bacterium]